MAVVSLSEAKNHLRVDQSAEDALIQVYLDAAIDYVRNFLNTDIPGELDSPVSTPSAIKAAIYLIVGGLYEHREQYSEVDIKENPAVKNLLFPYRRGMGI